MITVHTGRVWKLIRMENNIQCVSFFVIEILAHCIILDRKQLFAIKKEVRF